MWQVEKSYRVNGEIDDFLDLPDFDSQTDEAAHPWGYQINKLNYL